MTTAGSLWSRLAESAHRFPDKPATIFQDEILSWADVRRRGQPTADSKALDADVILAAQARRMTAAEVVVATTNVRHLSRLVDAKLWQDVAADSG